MISILNKILPFLFLPLILSSFTDGAGLSGKYMEVVMRNIGNKVLWSQGDSTSRVLPISYSPENDMYTISFENNIQITSDSLYDIVSRELKRVQITSFVAELKQCGTNDIILAIINSNPKDSIQPCRGRETPSDCYQIVITIVKNQRINQLSLTFIVLFGLVLTFFLYKNKFLRQASQETTQKTLPKNILLLGKYKFDSMSNKLYISDQSILLTDKEGKLLSLLIGSLQQPVSREHLMAEIWGESGVLVISRNIDVLVSKLRKKLSDDDSIKIINVHAVGYKLELEN